MLDTYADYYLCSKDGFLSDVKNHEVSIVVDEGLYRHVRFKAPDTLNLYFDITTWPGHLAISGDGPYFTFARLPDMFNFFRGYKINPGYWAEKARAVDKNGGLSQFSPDAFREAWRCRLNEYICGMPLSEAKRSVRYITDAFDDLGEPATVEAAVSEARSIRCPVYGTSPFWEIYEHRLEEWSYGFVWACRAIQWGIRQYDEAKGLEVA